MSLGALLDAGADQGGALRGLCYGLAGVYALLSAWALFKLLQLWRAAAGRHAGSGRCCACCGGWSSQRTLHALVLGVGVGAWHLLWGGRAAAGLGGERPGDADVMTQLKATACDGCAIDAFDRPCTRSTRF